MARTLKLPPLSRLFELFQLDAAAGVLVARAMRGRRIAGTQVGTPNNEGRLIVRVDYKIYYVHRLIWKMEHGIDPPDLIDHRNRDVGANAAGNLRSANTAQNGWNRTVNKNTISGLKGAHWSSSEQKWRSSIKKFGRSIHLGWFETKHQAHAAYSAASKSFYGEFSPFASEIGPRAHPNHNCALVVEK